MAKRKFVSEKRNISINFGSHALRNMAREAAKNSGAADASTLARICVLIALDLDGVEPSGQARDIRDRCLAAGVDIREALQSVISACQESPYVKRPRLFSRPKRRVLPPKGDTDPKIQVPDFLR